MTEIDEVGLVLGRHAEQREAVEELGKIKHVISLLAEKKMRKRFIFSNQMYFGVQVAVLENVPLCCQTCDLN